MTDRRPSMESTINPLELSTALARLGLNQYEECLRENGFDDWGSVTAITEADMTELGFKLGARRKLQRAIHEYNSSIFPAGYEARNLPPIPEGLPAAGESSGLTPRSSQEATRATRPYRRHPRPDRNAPRKPKTAYVLFGEHVRRNPTVGSASFVEVAKETGKRWRELPREERVDVWETPAAERLQEYKEELERYKETENYQTYQTYLESFEQRRHTLESTILSDLKVPSAPEPVSFDRLPASQGQEDFEASPQENVGMEDLKLESQPEEAASPVMRGMGEVRYVSKALGINSHLTRVMAFPTEDTTTKAVEAFIHGTGSLLYLWNRDEALNLVRSVYHPQSDSKPVDATEVFAMSAVGSYCDGNAHTMLVRERFLHLFLYMMTVPSNIRDLRRMRLFACLAICRFTNSVESARRLMRKQVIL